MAADLKPTARLPFTGGRPPHLPCGPGDVAADVLVPGDPDRVALLRDMLEDVQDFGRKREFALITGRYQGYPLSICSSGIGGPSTEIALVELAHLGAKRVVRIGGMSALVPQIVTGSYLVPDDAHRDDRRRGALHGARARRQGRCRAGPGFARRRCRDGAGRPWRHRGLDRQLLSRTGPATAGRHRGRLPRRVPARRRGRR